MNNDNYIWDFARYGIVIIGGLLLNSLILRHFIKACGEDMVTLIFATWGLLGMSTLFMFVVLTIIGGFKR